MDIETEISKATNITDKSLLQDLISVMIDKKRGPNNKGWIVEGVNKNLKSYIDTDNWQHYYDTKIKGKTTKINLDAIK